MESKRIRIVYDPVLRRPGCAILQAAYGCPGSLASLFDTQDWLLAPTPNLRVHEVTTEQLNQLPEITKRFREASSGLKNGTYRQV